MSLPCLAFLTLFGCLPAEGDVVSADVDIFNYSTEALFSLSFVATSSTGEEQPRVVGFEDERIVSFDFYEDLMTGWEGYPLEIQVEVLSLGILDSYTLETIHQQGTFSIDRDFDVARGRFVLRGGWNYDHYD